MDTIINILLARIVESATTATGRFSDGYLAALGAVRDVGVSLCEQTSEQSEWITKATAYYKAKFDAAMSQEESEE